MLKRLSFLKNPEIKNSAWIIGAQILQMAISLAVSMMTARYLGPHNYGVLNYTASFVSFFTSIASLGMEGVVIKKLIEHPDEEGSYLGSCILLRFLSSCLSTIAVGLIVYYLNPGEMLKVWLVLIQAMQLGFRSVQILNSWFQRYLKSKYVSIGRVIACVIVAAYKVFLLATSKSIVWFAVSNTLSDAIISFVQFTFYVQSGEHQKLEFHLHEGKEVLQQSYHFILSGLMVAIYGQMDKIMIGQMMDDISVGYYTTASAICGLWIFVPTAIINSFQPKIMELKVRKQEKSYLKRLEQLYSGIIWLCIAVSLGITVFSEIVIVILYGNQYLPAAEALRIMIWCETFSMIGMARGIWILCENKNTYVKYYLAIGAVVNLTLNYALIPEFGINGAAIATLITQFTTAILAPMLFKSTRIHTKIVMDAFILRWKWKGN